MRVITDVVPIHDNRNHKYVSASLLEGIDWGRMAKTDLDWKNKRQKIKEARLAAGLSFPEHSHWDWGLKGKQAEMLSSFQTLFSIEYEGEIQGMVIVDHAMHLTKLPPDRGKLLL